MKQLTERLRDRRGGRGGEEEKALFSGLQRAGRDRAHLVPAPAAELSPGWAGFPAAPGSAHRPWPGNGLPEGGRLKQKTVGMRDAGRAPGVSLSPPRDWRRKAAGEKREAATWGRGGGGGGLLLGHFTVLAPIPLRVASSSWSVSSRLSMRSSGVASCPVLPELVAR